MTQNHPSKNGFTLIELCAVIAILSILASLAVVAFSKFRTADYDTEGLENVNALYAQAQKNIAEWQIGSDENGGDFSLARKCYKQSDFANIGLSLAEGTHRWEYAVCYGIITQNSISHDSFIVAARPTKTFNTAQDRLIIFTPGIDKPLILNTANLTTLPKNVQLTTPSVSTVATLFPST